MAAGEEKIVYLGGWGRSGSTVIANILGSHPHAASVGEIRYVWDRGVVENKKCGCGSEFHGCDFWQRVFAAAGLSTDAATGERLTASVGSRGVYRQLLAMLPGLRGRYCDRHRADIASAANLYRAALDQSGARVLVDASKTPPYALNLLCESPAETRFVHLVRDPRAVAWSWARKRQTRETEGVEWFPQHSSVRSGVYWVLFNLLALDFRRRMPGRYLRVRYEDFCADPRAVTAQICEFCGLNSDGLDWTDSHQVRVTEQHSISGNPSRFNVGNIAIRRDDEWRTGMPAASRWLVTLICAPFLPLFGYPLRVPRDDGEQSVAV